VRPQDGRGGPEGRVRRVPEGAGASDGACRRGGSDRGQGSQKRGWERDVGNDPGPTRAMRGEWGPQFGRGGLEGRAGGESRRGGVRGCYCAEARVSRLVGWWW
jgi:hypothetical protein